jgi:hypothetical protein
VEFALISPVFLILVFATIDYGGYFGDRLSVENAARVGARVAAVQEESSFSGSSVVSAVTGHEGPAKLPTTTDCTWQGTTLDANEYPPFTFSGSGCIGIWYFDLLAAATGPPTLCDQWSVATQAWTTSPPPSGCVVAGEDIVVIGVGYRYTPFTPLPAIASNALTTYGETQLLEEGTTG